MKVDFFMSLLYFSVFYLALFLGDIALSSFQKIVSSDSLGELVVPRPRLQMAFVPLAVLFLILCFGMDQLFHWTTTPDMKFRSFYLSHNVFYLRTVIYFCIWGFLARQHRLETRLPSPPLVFILIVFSATFACFDWIQSLDSDFHSTALGLIFFLTCGLLALAFHLTQVRDGILPETLVKLNNLHLAFIGSWTYVVFMQFLIIWSGNIPKESRWYVIRLDTSWSTLAIALAVFQFAVPTVLLFFRSLKKSLAFTRGLGYLTIAMQALYIFWLIIPSNYHDGVPLSFMPLVSLVAVVLLTFYLHQRKPHGIA